MKKFREICTTVIVAAGAVSVLIGLYKWAVHQNISWITLLSTLFVTAIVFAVFKFLLIDPLKEKSDSLDKKINSNFDSLKQTTHEIYNAVMELQKDANPLHPLSPKAIGDWATQNSPLELNPKGRSLADTSGVSKIVEDNLPSLMDRLERLKLKTAYDVQNKAFFELGSFVLQTPDIEKKLKDFVFNNPSFGGKNIGFPDVIFVGSLLLRNKYLEKHKELKGDETEQPRV